MSPVARSSPVVRVVALVALAAVAVHELRFWVGFSRADAKLIHDEHAYLSLGLSLVGVLAVAGVASFVRSLGRARRSGTSEPSGRPRFARTWAATSAVLIAVYSGQELLEGVLAEGHPAGLGGIVGHAGWLALVLAVVFGAVIAWLLRGAHTAVIRAARGQPSGRRLGLAPTGRHLSLRALGSSVAVLARNLAGRAPPLSLS